MNFSRARHGALIVSLLFFGPAMAATNLDVDLGGSVRIGDDNELYFAISSRYFDEEPDVVDNYGVRYGDPDDLAVALYIGKQCGWSAETVFKHRSKGLGWAEIAGRCDLAPDVWFVPVRHEPGPPYGKAYGHWKNHQRNPKEPVLLSDYEIRDLMAVRMIHEYYGIPATTAMEMRASGRNLRALMSDEYHKRHGKQKNKGKARKHK